MGAPRSNSRNVRSGPTAKQPNRRRGAQPSSKRRSHTGHTDNRLVILQRVAVVVMILMVVVAALAVPARGYLNQRSEISEQKSDLDELKAENEDLRERKDRLDDPEEVKRIARRDYGLVLEGEESYTVLPSLSAGVDLPRAWPYDVLREPLEKASTGRS